MDVSMPVKALFRASPKPSTTAPVGVVTLLEALWVDSQSCVLQGKPQIWVLQIGGWRCSCFVTPMGSSSLEPYIDWRDKCLASVAGRRSPCV